MRGSDYNIEFSMRKLLHMVKERMEGKVQIYDMSDLQAKTLGFIASHKETGCIQKDLEDVLYRAGASITSMLKGMEKKGLIIRKVDPLDERKKNIYLTPRSWEIMQDFKVFFEESEALMLKGFSEQEKEQFASLIHKATTNIMSEPGAKDITSKWGKYDMKDMEKDKKCHHNILTEEEKTKKGPKGFKPNKARNKNTKPKSEP